MKNRLSKTLGCFALICLILVVSVNASPINVKQCEEFGCCTNGVEANELELKLGEIWAVEGANRYGLDEQMARLNAGCIVPDNVLNFVAAVDFNYVESCNDCDANGCLTGEAGKYSLDEQMARLNAGYITPCNVRNFTTPNTSVPINDCCDENCEHIGVVPHWPWTECTNILGHRWSDWGAWATNGRIIHNFHCGGTGGSSLSCTAPVIRPRWCDRTNCTAVDWEEGTIPVFC